MTSDRPYRKAVSHDEAIAALRKRTDEGRHNPDLVDRFIDCIEGPKEKLVESEADATVACESAD